MRTLDIDISAQFDADYARRPYTPQPLAKPASASTDFYVGSMKMDTLATMHPGTQSAQMLQSTSAPQPR